MQIRQWLHVDLKKAEDQGFPARASWWYLYVMPNINSLERRVNEWISDSSSSYFDFRRYIALGRKHQLERVCDDLDLPCRANTSALIVTFNPGPGELANIKRIANEFGVCVVIDNSNHSFRERILNQVPLLKREDVLFNGNHNGLAGALNLGIRHLLTRGAGGWIFFFDQDTEIKANFLSNIASDLSSENRIDLINSVYGTAYSDGVTAEFDQPMDRLVVSRDLITSGSFLSISAVKRIGLYIDELFIDSLDHEYCLRAKRFGLKIKRITFPHMFHSLGELKLRRFFWKKDVITHNHAPFRWYFFTRNFFLVGIDNLPVSLDWLVAHGFALTKSMIKVLLFEDSKFRKMRAAFYGIHDGVCMVFGKIVSREINRF